MKDKYYVENYITKKQQEKKDLRDFLGILGMVLIFTAIMIIA